MVGQLWLVALLCAGSLARAQPATAPAGESAAERRDRIAAFYSSILVGAYNHVGRHDPAWDSDARQVLEALSRQLAWSYCPSGDEWDIIATAGKRAADAGCNDPAVLLALARSSAYFNRRPEDTLRYYVEAAKRMGESGYHPLLKCLANFPAASLRARERNDPVGSRRAGRRLVEVGLEALPRAAADPNVPAEEILEALDFLGDASRYVERDRAIAFEKAMTLLADVYKDRPEVLLTARQQFLYDYAQDARRDSSIPEPRRQQLWQQRLDEAATLGAQAVNANRTNVRAPELMMHIESLRGSSPETIDQWFDRVWEAAPGRYRPCATRLSLYDPADPVQARAMLEFARRLAASRDWDSGLPMLLIEAHLRAASFDAGKRIDAPRREYFTPEVWTEIKSIYEPYLARFPDSVFHRCRYAGLATWAGDKSEARRVLESLGGEFSLAWFRSRDAWLALRAELAAQ